MKLAIPETTRRREPDPPYNPSHRLDCGHPLSETFDGFTNGTARDKDGHTICYDCAARQEWDDMLATGVGLMYVTKEPGGPDGLPRYYVANWTGRNCHYIHRWRAGRHNWAGYQVHFWFVVDEGEEKRIWHGVQWAGKSRLSSGWYCRVYRTKETV